LSKAFSSTEIATACIKLGWQFDRQSGSHMAFVKPGQPRPIIIPAGRDVIGPTVLSTICPQLGVKKRDLQDLVDWSSTGNGEADRESPII
jgi:predicted RNA binding protein YcfA (HicA-like mRNA interferase family)